MPKTVEIDEAELLKLQRTNSTLSDMFKAPKAKRKLLEALKEVRPDDPAVKELETPDPNEARFAELEKQNKDLATQIAADKEQREKNEKLAAIQAEQERGFAVLRAAKWTDDGIAKVKKVMEDKGILDVAIAANWIESQMPKQAPIQQNGSGWNFMEMPTDQNDDYKQLIESKGENDSLLRKMAGEAINEVRGTAR